MTDITFEQAVALGNDIDVDYAIPNRYARIFEIVDMFVQELRVSAEHDIIYLNAWEELVEFGIAKTDAIAELATLGCSLDEEMECLYIFT